MWQNVFVVCVIFLDLREVPMETATDHCQDSQFPSRDVNLLPSEWDAVLHIHYTEKSDRCLSNPCRSPWECALFRISGQLNSLRFSKIVGSLRQCPFGTSEISWQSYLYLPRFIIHCHHYHHHHHHHHSVVPQMTWNIFIFVSNCNAVVPGRGKLFMSNAHEENRRQGLTPAESNTSLEWTSCPYLVGVFG